MPKKAKLDNPLDIFLNKNNLTRRMITIKTGMSNGLLYNSTKKSIKRHEFNFYEKIGKAMGISGKQVLEELDKIEQEMLKKGELPEEYIKTIQ